MSSRRAAMPCRLVESDAKNALEKLADKWGVGKNKISLQQDRVGFVAKTKDEAAKILRAILKKLNAGGAQQNSWALPGAGGIIFKKGGRGGSQGKVAALFSGQGSQYPHMFEDVAMNWPTFRTVMADMNAASVNVFDGFKTSDAVYPRAAYEGEGASKQKELDDLVTTYAQPAIVACSVGSYEIFKAAGFKADVFAGHSLGELAAVHCAGGMTREVLCKLVCERSKVMSSVAGEGGMAAIIGKGALEKVEASGNGIWAANRNSPSQVVITGDKAKVQQEGEKFKASGFRVIPLKVKGAFHSPGCRVRRTALPGSSKARPCPVYRRTCTTIAADKSMPWATGTM